MDVDVDYGHEIQADNIGANQIKPEKVNKM